MQSYTLNGIAYISKSEYSARTTNGTLFSDRFYFVTPETINTGSMPISSLNLITQTSKYPFGFDTQSSNQTDWGVFKTYSNYFTPITE
jgi:predicted patatin/cPLA2 family phospholipase